ncbi:MAG: hypothetical protein Q7U16_07720 [Agitococcus sp.]|jgi:hypothetical protein|nr:hypothetical protein [Agitococcus sp.]
MMTRYAIQKINQQFPIFQRMMSKMDNVRQQRNLSSSQLLQLLTAIKDEPGGVERLHQHFGNDKS